MELEGKVAIITGAAGGIGECTAKSLLQSGASVVLFDLNKEKGEEAKKRLEQEYGKAKVNFISGSVAKREDIEGLFKTTVENFSKVDILINNAGIGEQEMWEDTLDVNFKGVVLGSHEAMKYMSKQHGCNGGVILNIASVVGLVPFALSPVYCATKHAVIGLTRSYINRIDLEKTGVKVIAICPGLTDTDMFKYATKFRYSQSKLPVENRCPIQRPENVGSQVPKLLKDAPNGSIWVIEEEKPAYQIFVPHYEKMTVPDDGKRYDSNGMNGEI